MSLIRKISIFFLLIAIVELWLLIAVGSAIGGLSTVVLVIATAVIGGYQARKQGFATWQRLRQRLDQGQLVVTEMLDTFVLLLAGILLLLPGILTDIVGFLLLVPALRHNIFKRFDTVTPQPPVPETVIIDVDLSEDKSAQ